MDRISSAADFSYICSSRQFSVRLPLKVLLDWKIPTGSTRNISAAGGVSWVDGGLEAGASIDSEIANPEESIGYTGVDRVIEDYQSLPTIQAGGE